MINQKQYCFSREVAEIIGTLQHLKDVIGGSYIPIESKNLLHEEISR